MGARFGFVPVVPPFVGAHQEEAVVAAYASALTSRGGERWSMDDLEADAPLVYLVATGGTERVVLEARAARARVAPREPVVLVAHPGNNSLPASLEVLARLHQDGERGRIVYLSGPDDVPGLAAIEAFVGEATVARTLARSRIGLVGDPSDWLVASMPAPEVVRDAWGPSVVEVAMSELERRIADAQAPVRPAGSALWTQATEVLEPSEAEVSDVLRVQQALRGLAEDEGLDAVTVRCFDLVLSLRTTGCYALAELNDAGIVAGCEGDLVSTVGMLWLRHLLDAPAWMANPAQLDLDANTVVLAHCTVPRTMVSRYRLRSHFESGLGVGIQGDLPAGPVTLVRIGGARMEWLWLAEGAIVRSGDAEDLCRTQALVRLSAGHASELLTSPLGNHVLLAFGHHADRLRSYWQSFVASGAAREV